MNTRLVAVGIIALALVAAASGAQQPPAQPQAPRAQRTTNYPAPVAGDYVIDDFKFTTGETLPQLKLHYQTIGTPRRDAKGIVPLERYGESDEIASTVRFLCGPGAGYITGQTVHVNGGQWMF